MDRVQPTLRPRPGASGQRPGEIGSGKEEGNIMQVYVLHTQLIREQCCCWRYRRYEINSPQVDQHP